MSDSRQRFEAWYCTIGSPSSKLDLRQQRGQYINGFVVMAWHTWQAAERATAARCAEIAEKLAATYHAAYKSSYHQHDDGMCDGAGEVETAIRAAFPECFE